MIEHPKLFFDPELLQNLPTHDHDCGLPHVDERCPRDEAEQLREKWANRPMNHIEDRLLYIRCEPIPNFNRELPWKDK